MSTLDPEPLPSRGLVLEVLRAERGERRGHSDALDQKAGLALGSAGVLVTLSNNIAQPWRGLGAGASMVSAALALWSFWPRPYPVLDHLRAYLAAPTAQTELVLVDTLDEMNLSTHNTAVHKALRLKAALTALAVAVMMLGSGVIQHSGGGYAGRRLPTPAAAPTAAPAAAG